MNSLIQQYMQRLKKKLAIRPSPQLLVHAIELFHGATEQLTQIAKQTRHVRFACQKGCAHCCSLRVEVLPPEAFFISNHIKTWPQAQQASLIKRLEQHVLYADERSFVQYNRPCPFLTANGACSIYAVRPHKCRANLSLNVQPCIETGDGQEDTALKSAHGQLAIQTILFYKHKKLVMNPAELGASVLAALTNSGLQQEWAQGVQVFKLLPEKIQF
ncbi:MAG TPA: YkgJ family cysteine cluster protein [Marinagarivorans sp.]|nr:YkgJ family cysteine cluster protein [Cellvibrionaceae bacterium]HMY38196.1 YkgJ family cysteine cluster protein [Marinagarivorans sp.]HNG60002.1 YkgJ family cysteine cluster protein [Cellvibrionaceae bacterium]